ncbi:hypothetical protein F511_04861 [Dorcoceras hygrometricum]|uniref:Uncharacterized protein n=1 Tax=Dorcoceras hygrometricum TaxID=472368 RepID=A0A2Z7DDM9_9LAMI|nr:hypothetical protein F511_04861 [Dorcoceras hygrometricum]
MVKVTVAPAGGIGISRYGDISVTHEDLLVLSTMVKVTVAPAGGIGISRYGDISVTHEDLLVLARLCESVEAASFGLVDASSF